MLLRSCPICGTPSSSAKLFLKQNIDPSRMSNFSFASRKTPEFMCHQLVKCLTCDLVYANSPPDQETLAHAYHISDFDSTSEADDAAAAYIRAIQPILRDIKNKKAALEIGTGTGIFLQSLKEQGFEHVVGIEPSSSAIAAAPAHRQAWIRESIFREADFEPESFDLICCFMTLEHVRDPNDIVSAASRLLRPSGVIILITHNYHSWINRLLGKRSPIIDIEHMQLFSPLSIERLLTANKFKNVRINSFYNRYAVRYWIRLLPINFNTKQKIIKTLDRIGFANNKLTFNVGNILSYGYRSNK